MKLKCNKAVYMLTYKTYQGEDNKNEEAVVVVVLLLLSKGLLEFRV